MVEKTKPGKPVFFDLAYLYKELDEPEKMFYYLNKSVDAKENDVRHIKGHIHFLKYRKDPRFDKLIKKMGLLQ